MKFGVTVQSRDNRDRNTIELIEPTRNCFIRCMKLNEKWNSLDHYFE